MTIFAKVHNHRIALPAELQVEEGTEVQVTFPERRLESAATQIPAPEWLRRSRGTATSGLSTDAIMRQTRGEE
jgi:hypothetical protein